MNTRTVELAAKRVGRKISRPTVNAINDPRLAKGIKQAERVMKQAVGGMMLGGAVGIGGLAIDASVSGRQRNENAASNVLRTAITYSAMSAVGRGRMKMMGLVGTALGGGIGYSQGDVSGGMATGAFFGAGYGALQQGLRVIDDVGKALNGVGTTDVLTRAAKATGGMEGAAVWAAGFAGRAKWVPDWLKGATENAADVASGWSSRVGRSLLKSQKNDVLQKEQKGVMSALDKAGPRSRLRPKYWGRLGAERFYDERQTARVDMLSQLAQEAGIDVSDIGRTKSKRLNKSAAGGPRRVNRVVAARTRAKLSAPGGLGKGMGRDPGNPFTTGKVRAARVSRGNRRLQDAFGLDITPDLSNRLDNAWEESFFSAVQQAAEPIEEVVRVPYPRANDPIANAQAYLLSGGAVGGSPKQVAKRAARRLNDRIHKEYWFV